MIERAVITAKGGRLRLHLSGVERAGTPGTSVSREAQTLEVLSDEATRDLERKNLLAALERAGGKI